MAKAKWITRTASLAAFCICVPNLPCSGVALCLVLLQVRKHCGLPGFPDRALDAPIIPDLHFIRVYILVGIAIIMLSWSHSVNLPSVSAVPPFARHYDTAGLAWSSRELHLTAIASQNMQVLSMTLHVICELDPTISRRTT